MKRLVALLILWAFAMFPFDSVGRSGIVVFQFDDARISHYTDAFPTLEKWGLKGSFGVNTEAVSNEAAPNFTPAQLKEMLAKGHEMHDHTLRHDAAFWGADSNRNAWGDTIAASLALLESWGVTTDGWNQPGGPGQGFSTELRDTLIGRGYTYSAGRVGLSARQTQNHHWNFRDDPFYLGRGGIDSWGFNGGGGTDLGEFKAVLKLMADGLAAGGVVIPLFHTVTDSVTWALSAICSSVVDWGVPVMTARDAWVAVSTQNQYTPDPYENIWPNPNFSLDLDAGGEPDAWNSVTLAGAVSANAWAWLYGPETGPTEIRFTAIAPASDAAYLHIRWYHLATPGGTYTETTEQWNFTVPAYSRNFVYHTTVPSDCDRVKMTWGGIATTITVSNASWRKMRKSKFGGKSDVGSDDGFFEGEN